MSALPASPHPAPDSARPSDVPRRIAVLRAVLALVWAAALVVAARHRAPSTASDVPFAAAALLTTYPAIDAVSSIVDASRGTPAFARLLRVNAAISTLAIAALAVTAFGLDAGSALVAFGAWAAVSGALQLATAIRHGRSEGYQPSMIISGGLSTLAGLSFIAAARADTAHLANIAYYMAFGAVLFLLSAVRGTTSRGTTRPQTAR